jgi:hypothetical protein
LKQKDVKIFKLFIVVQEKIVSILVRISVLEIKILIDVCSGDYDYSPLCEFKPVCQGKPNGNYVDQYRPNCQFHYTCLENRTFNYTACEHGHRFSVQHQKCLPAKQVKCLGIILNDHLSLKIYLLFISLVKFFM